MTKSVTVTYDDHLFWAYDQALSLLFKYVIDVAEERGLDEDQRWAPKVALLRGAAGIPDVGLRLDNTTDGWHLDDYPVLCETVNFACARLSALEHIPAAEAAPWRVLGDLGLRLRTHGDVPTTPSVDLGRAVVELVNGELPDEPEGSWWGIGFEGRRQGVPYDRALHFVALTAHLADRVLPARVRPNGGFTSRFGGSELTSGKPCRMRGALGFLVLLMGWSPER